jgi:diguanylate cyclase (GGDEF)-like protein
MSVYLRTIVTLLFAGMLTILTFLLGSIFTDKATEVVQKEVGQSLAGYSFQMADKLDVFMATRFKQVQLVGGLPAFREQNLAKEQMLIDELKLKFPSFSWIGLTDAQGKIIASSDGILKGESIAERPVFLNAQTEPFIGDVHDAVLLSKLLPNPSGEPLQFVDISVPVFDENKAFSGVFSTHLSWNWAEEVKNTLTNTPNQEEELEVLIVSKRDNTILLGPKDLVGKPMNAELMSSLKSSDNQWTLAKWSNNKTYVTGYALGDGHEEYGGLGWTVVVRQPIDVAYEAITELEEFVWVVGGVCIFLFSLVGWILADQIARPIRMIAAAAREVGESRRSEIPVIHGVKEVEELSISIRNMVQTITMTQTALNQMETLAHRDTLTGLPNRIALYEKMEATLLQSDEKWLIFFMDLDGFKDANDRYGHLTGDMVLKVVAERLTKFANHQQFVSRLGGDEFVFLTPCNQADCVEEGQACMDEIISLIGEPIRLTEANVTIGCSIGAAIYPLDNNHPIEVMHLADEALYVSKQNGKNQGNFYSNKRNA